MFRRQQYQCEHCGTLLEESDRGPFVCDSCAEEVFAFQANGEVDEWFIVGYVEEGINVLDQLEVDGDQCGNCGGPVDEFGDQASYIVHVVNDHYAYVMCTCGDEKPVRVKQRWEVIG